MNMVNSTFISTEDTIGKLQQIKEKTKLKFYKIISNYYDNMNIRFVEDPFAENAQGISNIYHEVLQLMKILQFRPQVKNLKYNYNDLFYTVTKNRDEKESVDNQYKNDFFSLNVVIIPNHYVGREKRDLIYIISNVLSYINREAKMNSRKCVICNVEVHRASYVKRLRSKKHLENIKQNEMIIPEWLFKEPIENKNIKKHNPRSLKQIARDNIRLDDKQLNKELAKKMLNPYYFTDRNLKVEFKFNLDSHHINRANSKLTILPNYP